MSRVKRLLALLVLGLAVLGPVAWALATVSIDVTDGGSKFVCTFQGNDAVTGNVTVATGTGLSYTPGVYAQGTGAGKLNLFHLKTYTIGASSSTTLVLGDGSLKQPDQSAAAFTKIREIWIGLPSSNAASAVVIGNAAANTWAGAGLPLVTTASQVTVTKAGGPWRVSLPTAGGYAVSAGATEQLKIVNSDGGNSATVLVMIAGE